jgi:hypothetical protein
MKIETPWDFVEKYYPNYYSSDDITYNDDLHKLVDREFEIGDGAYDLLIQKYGGDINNPQILIDIQKSDVEIYEKAIEGYIKILN